MSSEIASLYTTLSANATEYIATLDSAIAKGAEYEVAQKRLQETTHLTGTASGSRASATTAAAAADEDATKAAEHHTGALRNLASSATGVVGVSQLMGPALGLGFAGISIGSLKAAGDFQQLTTQLVTGAGESAANLEMVRQGIMAMAPQVGITADELAKGLYNIESAGFHGAQGLGLLKAAAQGAAVGGADMATVADGLTTAMTNYSASGLSATQMTNDLIATVAAGKMHMQDLASSLGTVLPAASATGVSLQQVSAAIATMTARGTPAADAATYLRMTLLQLENPSGKASDALKSIGLTAGDVHNMLADPNVGLAGTISDLSDRLSRQFGAGSQEYVAHLADIVGGSKSMQAALELTGPGLATFKANLESISQSVANGKDQINGFSDVQGDFNFKMDAAKASLENAAIAMGDKLLPAAGELADWFVNTGLPSLQAFSGWVGDNVVPALEQMGHWIGDNIVPVLQRFGGWMESDGIPDLELLGGFLGRVGAVVVEKVGPPLMQLVSTVLPQLGKLFTFVAENIHYLEPYFDAMATLAGAMITVFTKFVDLSIGNFYRMHAVIETEVGAVRYVIDNFVGFFTALPGRILNAVTSFPGLLKQAGSDLINGLWGAAMSAASGMWTWFQNLPGTIYGLFSGAGSWLYQIGRDLIGGLWNGLKDAITSIPGDVVGGIKSIPGRIGGFLGISSPSKLMHDEVGWWMGAGIQTGLLANLASFNGSPIRAAILDNLGATSGGASMAALGTPTNGGVVYPNGSVPDGLGGIGGGGGGIVVNLVVNGANMDEAELARRVRDELVIAARQTGQPSILAGYA